MFFLSGNLLKDAQGPYYLNFYDPSYVYLINSLNLAQMQGYGVGHFDHPGTTVQMAGAVLLKIGYMLRSPGEDIAKDVLKHPEEYLFFINRIFGLLNSTMLLILGIVAFRITGNIFYSMLIQLTPFSSMENFYGYIIVTPDNFLILATMMLISILIYYLYSETEYDFTSAKLIMLFAVVSAFGLATKLNFLPLVLIPMILIKGTGKKIIYFILSVIMFHVFIIPALSNYVQFTDWVKNLLLYSGHYGEGEKTIVDTTEFFISLKLIFTKDIFFTFTYAAVVFTVAISIVKRKLLESSGNDLLKRHLKLLFSVFFAMTVQIIIVSKQYRQHYLIPSFMISVFSLILCSYVLSYCFKSMKLKINYTAVTILILSFASWQIYINYELGSYQRDEAFRIEKFINDNCGNKLLIPVFSTANKECALAFAVSYAGSQKERYRSIVLEMRDMYLFYNPWKNVFHTMKDKTDIKKILTENKNFNLQIPESYLKGFIETLNKTCDVKNSAFTKKFTNGNNESVYEIQTGN